jgi:hypothetical protein
MMSRSLRTLGVVGAALTMAVLVDVAVPVATASVPVPTISSFTPTSATVGTVVTIDGSGLAGATEVAFNFIDAPITSDTDTQIITKVPLGEDRGPITVTTPGGTASSPSTFTLDGFYVTTTSLPGAVRGFGYYYQLQAAGGTGPYLWSHTGSLPPGMRMSRSGVLSGIPSLRRGASGPYPLTLHARDSTKRGHLLATRSLSLTLS